MGTDYSVSFIELLFSFKNSASCDSVAVCCNSVYREAVFYTYDSVHICVQK